MNESLGGAVNIFLIVFFLIIIALYLAFNVNYQKAFNVKNRIVELYEEYDGNCMNNQECKKEIDDYESRIGYGNISPKSIVKYCESRGMNVVAPYNYCHKGIEVNDSTENEAVYKEGKTQCYFDIVTFVEIDIPVINNLMNLRMFQVSGQTKQISISGSCGNYAKAELE